MGFYFVKRLELDYGGIHDIDVSVLATKSEIDELTNSSKIGVIRKNSIEYFYTLDLERVIYKNESYFLFNLINEEWYNKYNHVIFYEILKDEQKQINPEDVEFTGEIIKGESD